VIAIARSSQRETGRVPRLHRHLRAPRRRGWLHRKSGGRDRSAIAASKTSRIRARSPNRASSNSCSAAAHSALAAVTACKVPLWLDPPVVWAASTALRAFHTEPASALTRPPALTWRAFCFSRSTRSRSMAPPEQLGQEIGRCEFVRVRCLHLVALFSSARPDAVNGAQ
jgi:hypothetical protein